MSRTLYGGQAVIEGVMMRGPRDVAVAVRRPSGEIVVHQEPLVGAIYRSRLAKLPFIRGAIMLWDTMALGLRLLVFSANVQLEAQQTEEERAENKPAMPPGMMWGMMAVSLAVAIGVFFVTPVLVMGVLDRFLASSVVSNLIEKLIRLALMLGYMWGIGRLPDIQRVFAYHGAEHKTVNAHEAGAPLDVEHVRTFSTVHPRCGTTFLIIVVLVSFFVFTLLGQPPLLLRILSRIVLLPLVAGVAYEVMRLAAGNLRRGLVKALIAPGLAVQALTTREPDDSQLETAIVALKTVLEAEAARAAGLEPALAASGVPIQSPSAG